MTAKIAEHQHVLNTIVKADSADRSCTPILVRYWSRTTLAKGVTALSLRHGEIIDHRAGGIEPSPDSMTRW